MKRKIIKYLPRLFFKFSFFTCTLCLGALVPLLIIFSCDQSTGPGEDITEVANKLIIYTGRTSIVANKGSASVLAKVFSESDTSQAVSGVRVQFTVDNSATI